MEPVVVTWPSKIAAESQQATLTIFKQKKSYFAPRDPRYIVPDEKQNEIMVVIFTDQRRPGVKDKSIQLKLTCNETITNVNFCCFMKSVFISLLSTRS